MSQISISRALVTLKRTNDQINTAIASGKYVSRTIGKNQYKKVGGSNDSVEQMTAKIQSSFDTVDGLIAKRQKIKSAIVLSNANTFVSIMGQTMTVAEIIELKSTVAFKEQYLQYLRVQLQRENTEVKNLNQVVDNTIDTLLTSIYGADKAKIDGDTFKNVATPQKEQKEAALLDPAKIESRIAKLTEEISVLSSEVDLLLSESNAKTMIEIAD